MCKPRKPTKANLNKWHEDKDDFRVLCQYCIQDVEAEHSLSSSLYDLSDKELEIWQLDQKINDMGVYIDVDGAKNLIGKVEESEKELLKEITLITNGKVSSPRQVAVSIDWLSTYKVEVENLQKETVKDLLKQDIPDNVKRFLQIRQSLGKSSVSKLKAMVNMADADNRIRGAFLFSGAHTKRWTGRGFQPHNFPRDTYSHEDIESILTYDNETIELLYASVFHTASKCLRGMITVEKGNIFYCADFSAIEARVLAWLANEVKTLNAFREGKPIYKLAASDIFGVPIDKVSSYQRLVGKVSVLALGYQGYIGAFQSMAPTYGVHVEDERAAEIAMAWRKNNPNIVAFWKGIESAAKMAVKTGRPHKYGMIKFGMRDKFLHMRLPSGNILSYYDPEIDTVTTKYGQVKEVISYMGVNPKTKKWERQLTYGGKLTENAVQGSARCLLAWAMLRADKAGYTISMHVHDEILSEVPKGFGSLEDFINIMSEVPDWAKGCPLGAEGWEGIRYRK